MKVGAEPKKVAILGGLLVVAGYFLYSNLFSGGGGTAPVPTPQAQSTVAPEPAPVTELGRPVPRAEPPRANRRSLQDFRPSLRPRRAPTERPDLSSIDPTLRVDLILGLQQVAFAGGTRSLFEFSAAPLPKTPEPKIIPKPMVGPVPPPANPAKPGSEVAAKPPATPIPLRFFGYTVQARVGNKRAIFLDGDEIHVASEGDVVKKRYKVVRIGVNSVVVEDIEQKNEQTLKLEAEAS
jgi:hypothetical protein